MRYSKCTRHFPNFNRCRKAQRIQQWQWRDKQFDNKTKQKSCALTRFALQLYLQPRGCQPERCVVSGFTRQSLDVQSWILDYIRFILTACFHLLLIVTNLHYTCFCNFASSWNNPNTSMCWLQTEGTTEVNGEQGTAAPAVTRGGYWFNFDSAYCIRLLSNLDSNIYLKLSQILIAK